MSMTEPFIDTELPCSQYIRLSPAEFAAVEPSADG